jgi:hypothetical protein
MQQKFHTVQRFLIQHTAVCFCLIVGLSVLAQSLLTLNYDNAWLLLMAQRVYGGMATYPDAGVEINPPLMIYIYTIAAYFSDVLRVPLTVGFCLLVYSAGILSLILTWCVLKIQPQRICKEHRVFLMLALSIGYFWIAGGMFGQREHFMMFMAIPYFLLGFWRLLGVAIPGWITFLVGVLVALCVCLKPFFLLVYFGAEILIALRRGIYQFFSLSLLGSLLTGGVFTFIVLTYNSYFIDTILPNAGAFYASAHYYTNISFIFQLSVLSLTGVCFLVFQQKQNILPTLKILILWLLAVCFLLAFYSIIQMKGFDYHGLPLFILAATCLLFIAFMSANIHVVVHATVGIIVGFLLLVYTINPIVSPLLKRQSDTLREQNFLKAIPDFIPKNPSYVSLIFSPFTPWPNPITSGWQYAGRMGSLWYITTVLLEHEKIPSALLPTIEYFDAFFMEDIINNTPLLLVVGTGEFDVMAHFISKPNGAVLRNCYAVYKKIERYTVYINLCRV